MQVFLNDFPVFGTRKAHLQHVELCLEKCRKARLSLNPAKCAFAITSGMLLRHIVSKEGIAIVECGHLMAVSTLSIGGRAILVICWNSAVAKIRRGYVNVEAGTRGLRPEDSD
jgi:hypothetical protein